MREKILGFIAFLFIRLLGTTYRYKLHFNSNDDKDFFYKCYNQRKPTQDTKYLLAFFHQDELCLLNFFRNRNMSVLISISKDGEIMYNNARLLGFSPVRGSSSKRAVAGLIAAIKKVRAGYKMAFAVDGPRGPIYKVKDGIVAVSKKTNTPILPVRAVADRQKVFERSWNKAKLPKLFSHIDFYFAPAKMYTKEELEQALLSL